MATKDMSEWQTSICQVIGNEDEDKIIVRGHDLNDLIDDLSFAGMMFLMLQGRKPTPAQTRILDALLVASMEHGIAPPSMVARCYASYGTSIQAAIGSGINAFGDRMGGLGEQLAKYMVECLSDIAGGPAPDDEALQQRAATLVAGIMARGERVPGYGIPLHGADPRAPKVLEIARQQGIYGIYGRFADAIGNELAAARGGRAVPMNLDGVGAMVAMDLGFHWRATRMFLLTPRSVSMGAHFLEELEQDSTWRHIPADQIEYQE
ncbi:MAG: citrate/2-methylcitrate synthase [Alphaproteobacteria bacterium]